MRYFTPSPDFRGDSITTREWNRLKDVVAKFLKLTVQPPLTLNYVNGSPVVGLQGGIILDAVTTSTITVRVGNQMGHGKIRFRVTNATGLLQAPSGPEFKAWNITGGTDPIPTGVRCYVSVVGSLVRIIAADCSGSS